LESYRASQIKLSEAMRFTPNIKKRRLYHKWYKVKFARGLVDRSGFLSAKPVWLDAQNALIRAIHPQEHLER
jgi:hypothetical protein